MAANPVAPPPLGPPKKRDLCLTIEPYGTLIWPKAAAAAQIVLVGEEHGFTGFTEAQAQAALDRSWSYESTRHPRTGPHMVIRGTLQALVSERRRITRSTFNSMIEKLLQFYGTGEGYTTEPLLKEMFKSLRSNNDGNRFGELVVGVVCDSDDSVPTILRNLGLVCRELRLISTKLNDDPNVYDIDFFSLAIDVGAEKPRGSVFAAARCMLSKILQQKKILTNSNYQRVHIGDSWDKDVLGAIDAGWHAIFVDRKRTKPDVPRLIDLRLPTLDEVFEEKSVVIILNDHGENVMADESSIAGQTMPDDIVPEDCISDDNLPDDIVPDDSISDDSPPDDNLPDDKLADDIKIQR
ncbi:HAD-like domain protein [Moelleriella libera RCEF 2490]|uniref:HAD-like domain protein n=1 Tax=Moelleriella libera RCEF 2490 TaxID=1081109 RepID=A0A166V4R1_9HYPO|nr:HAD-like domain protein [Moelleriella libera RCEF 2490]